MKQDPKRRSHDALPYRNPAVAVNVFISTATKALPYSNVSWDDAVWDIGSSNQKTRAHLPGAARLYFTAHAATRAPLAQRKIFEKPFADLVKACIAKRRINRGMGSGPQGVFLRATRYLYEVLPLPVRRDTTLISNGHFVMAESAIRTKEAESSAYRAAVHLQEFGEILDRHGLCRAPIEYRSSIGRPTNHTERTSAKFEERVSGLPTNDALDALAIIANEERLRERPFDLLRMRITELLFLGGFRVGEVLSLPADTLIREPVLDETGAPQLDAVSGKPLERIGLRYWPEKGGEPIPKWLATVANPMVLRALQDIQDLCTEARENAQWLDDHPGTINLDVKDEDRISLSRAARIVGITTGSFRLWVKQRGRGGDHIILKDSDGLYVFGASLKRAIAADRFERPMLRRANGYVQNLGGSLLVMFLWDWSENRGTNRHISIPLSWGNLSDFLSGRPNIPSIFERFEQRDVNGECFRFRSHDFRRLLNTVAQNGGLSQVEIARWMGRRRIEDNAAYDYRSASDMAEEMRSLIEKNEVFGSIADHVMALPLIERATFLDDRLTMLHTTPLGQCGSNIAENPCATAVSCLGGCRHYLRKKNDSKSRAALLRIERETVEALDRAYAAAAAGKPNAINWIQSHERVLRTVRAALAIDDDPLLLNGETRAVNPNGPMLGEPL